MGMAAYFKGVRLWEILQELNAPATRTGATQQTGITQEWAKANPQSPNFTREVLVKTVQDPVESGYASDIDEATTALLALVRTEAYLVSNAKTAGHVSWCQDPAHKADVTGGPHTGSAVITHGAVGGTWVPTTGRLALCRNPTTGEGFVAVIGTVVAGVSMQLTVPAEYTVGSTWDLVSVQLAFPECTYTRMSYGARTVFQGGEWRPSIEYSFGGNAAPLYSADHQVPVDDS